MVYISGLSVVHLELVWLWLIFQVPFLSECFYPSLPYKLEVFWVVPTRLKISFIQLYKYVITFYSCLDCFILEIKLKSKVVSFSLKIFLVHYYFKCASLSLVFAIMITVCLVFILFNYLLIDILLVSWICAVASFERVLNFSLITKYPVLVHSLSLFWYTYNFEIISYVFVIIYLIFSFILLSFCSILTYLSMLACNLSSIFYTVLHLCNSATIACCHVL